MGQSVTYYSASQPVFEQVAETKGRNVNLVKLSDGWVTLQGTFMALEFILPALTRNRALVAEMFHPSGSFEQPALKDKPIDLLEEDELEDYFSQVLFHKPAVVQKIGAMLEPVTPAAVQEAYNPIQLNEANIYPVIWKPDNDRDVAYTGRHLTEEFTMLKAFYQVAAKKGNYVLCFAG